MNKVVIIITIAATLVAGSCSQHTGEPAFSELKKGFLNPPDSARPGVYWFIMDGNISKQGITADLESMKAAGLGSVLFMEVNVGIPRGKVDFMSEEWMNLFTHVVRESERLGIAITLGVGPGWTGSGGPWVTGAQSMKHLVYSLTQISESETLFW
jgi:hypothetical protein